MRCRKPKAFHIFTAIKCPLIVMIYCHIPKPGYYHTGMIITGRNQVIIIPSMHWEKSRVPNILSVPCEICGTLWTRGLQIARNVDGKNILNPLRGRTPTASVLRRAVRCMKEARQSPRIPRLPTGRKPRNNHVRVVACVVRALQRCCPPNVCLLGKT